MICLLQIHHKLIDPQTGPLPHRRRLCRLIVREGKRRLILLLPREFCECCDHIDQLAPDQTERLPHQNDIRVVADIAARGAEMNDSLCLRALHAVRVDMAHHVMAHFLLAGSRHIVVDVVLMRLHLLDHFVCDPGDAELLLRLRERDPEPSPGAELVILRENKLHLPACIPLRERTDVTIRGHINLLMILHGYRQAPFRYALPAIRNHTMIQI